MLFGTMLMETSNLQLSITSLSQPYKKLQKAKAKCVLRNLLKTSAENEKTKQI